MIGESIDDIENELFSHLFFAQQKIDSLSSTSVANGHIPQGHGPFFKNIDQKVKYDLTCSKEGILLGYSHPLVIRSRLESLAHSVLIYSVPFAPEKEKSVSSMILNFFGKKEFQYVRLYPNRWEILYTIFENIGVFASPQKKILCLGERPREILSQNSFSIFDRKELLKLLDKDKVRDFSCVFVNLHRQKHPTETIDDALISEALIFAKHHALPVVAAELYFWGSYSNFLSLNQEFLEDVDYYLLGNNLPLNAAVSKKKIVEKSRPCISVEKLLLMEKMLCFLTEGIFYGKEGRILDIQQEISGRLTSFPHTSRGLIFTLSFFDKDVKKIHETLFDRGLICEFSDKNINLYFPITLLSKHIHEICEIIKTTSKSVSCLN